MSSISSSIRLSDQMSPTIKSMLTGMNAMVAGFERMESSSKGAVDTKSIALARSEMSKAGAAMKQYEDSVAKAAKEQKEFNSTAKASASSMGGLITKVGALAAGYMSLQAVGSFIGMSDVYSQTTARLGLMNDGLQTTAALQEDIFKAANDSRAPYQAMADMVGKMGILAKDAFSTNDETVEFAEQISKQFVISGTSAQGAEAATLQLTQAMGSGVLRGEELNSVFEQAPTIIQSIADYLGVPIGQIRAMAQEGEITADIVKESMFKAANATDAKFEAMGMTFGQAWTIFQNKSGRAFQGVFTQMGQLANSDALDGFLDGLAGGIETAAGIVSSIGGGIASITELPIVKELMESDIIGSFEDLMSSAESAAGTVNSAISEIKSQLQIDSPQIKESIDTMNGSIERLNQLAGETPDVSGIGQFASDVVIASNTVATALNDINIITQLAGETLGKFFRGDFAGAADSAIETTGAYLQMQQDMGLMGTDSAKAYTGSFREVLTGNTEIAAAAAAPLSSIPPQANMFGQQASTEYGAGMLINQGAVQSASAQLVITSQKEFSPMPTSAYEVGANSMIEMGKAIAEGEKGTGKSATGVKAMIGKVFEPLPGDTRSTADYMMAGLKAGLDDSGSVEKTIVSLTGLMLDTFKNKLGIHSPSTEMYDIGTNTMAGLFNSLADSDLVKFCESIVADMKAAFEAGNFNIQAGIEYLGGGAAEFFKSIGIGGASLGQLITPLAGDVTSEFGWRTHPITGDQRFHEGIDIGAGAGTPIGAAGAGTVIFAGWNGGYGNMVEIDHGNGLTSLYAHMDSILTSLGQTVSAGQTIGTVGSTGNSTGPHLHFGLYQDGQPIDPGALWGYSSGTLSARAGLHLVGENGPEIIGFNGGETVLNSKKTKLFQSQGGYGGGVSVSGGQGVTVQVNMNGVTISSDMDIEVVADRLGSLIVEKMRTRSSVA